MEKDSYKEGSLGNRMAMKRKGFAKNVPEVVSSVVEEGEEIICAQEVEDRTQNNNINHTLLGDSSLHFETASSRKLRRNIVSDLSDIAEEFPDDCTLLFNSSILITTLTEVGKCPGMAKLGDIDVEHLVSEKKTGSFF